SAITPPVALAAYAGAGIAKCDPMITAIQACKIGFAGFIVPFVFCYDSAMMLNGDLVSVLKVVSTALVGCVGMSCGMQGWYFSKQRKISMPTRLIVIAGGLCMMIASDLTSIVGLVVLVAVALFEKKKSAKLAA
ncbi:MAG: TRAP transporter permease, partial [Oscillospiraceae bacterium]|nr:TRAP transporter permease [Oscillospiraceae bacterium]